LQPRRRIRPTATRTAAAELTRPAGRPMLQDAGDGAPPALVRIAFNLQQQAAR
jgi:hypothetical protein